MIVAEAWRWMARIRQSGCAQSCEICDLRHIERMSLLLRALPFVVIILAIILMQRRAQRVFMERLHAQSRLVVDPEIVERLAAMTRALGVSGGDVREWPNPNINALAGANGHVYLTSGLLDQFRAGQLDADQIAAVIAHEIGHIRLGHNRQRVAALRGATVVQLVLSGLANRLVPILGPWLLSLLTSAAMARLSRRDEFQADAYGVALMQAAGLDARASTRMLAHLRGHELLVPQIDWLASHPPLDERIAAIEAQLAQPDKLAV